jgi:HK97 family phage portal protein
MWPFDKAEKRASLENPQVPLSDVNAWRQLIGEWHNVAGVDVTHETALENSAVWCAVNFIAGSFASLPLQVFKKGENGAKDVDEGDPLYAMLHDSPNGEWTSFNWRKYSMTNVLVNGGRAYTFIERNLARRVTNLWPLDPMSMMVKRQAGKRSYHYKDGDRTVIYQPDEILDIPFMLRSDGVTHVDPVSKLKGAVGLSIALERYAQKFFANGGVPPLALQGTIGSPAAASRAATDVTSAIRAANEERRNVIVLPSGYTLNPVGFDPQKSQMTEGRQFQLGEIARMYGLPPVFLQDLTHGTYSNTEQQDLAYVKHTLTTWLEAWEQEMNLKLFGPRSKKFVEFNVDGLLRGDFETRMSGYAKGIQNAIITPDEARAAENRPAKGGPADKLQIQGATVELGKNVPKAAAPAPANDNTDTTQDPKAIAE